MSSNSMWDEKSEEHKALRREHILLSLTLFSSYGLLGAFLSILGPAVPFLARDMGVRETDFGATFSTRGLGYFLGSWAAPITLPGIRDRRLQRKCNNRMHRLGFCTAGMGIFALAMSNSPTLSWNCVWGFLQGLCCGLVETTSNTTMSSLHGTGVAPWMQGLHLSLSLGALISPAAVGQFGYVTAFLVFGLLALPSSLACFLAGAKERGNECCSGQSTAMKLEQYLRTDPSMMKDVELAVENGRFFESVASEESAMGEEIQNGKCGFDQPGQLSEASKNGERRIVSESSPPETESTPILPISGHMTERVEETFENGHSGNRSIQKYGTSSKENASSSKQEMTVELDTLGDVLKKSERRASPVLVALLAGVLFLYVGAEVGFGGWIAVIILQDHLASKAAAARITSLFWGGIALGRLLAIPVAVHFKTETLMRANLLGGIVSSILLLIFGTVVTQDSLAWVAAGTGLFGVSMASIYPLSFSLLPSWGFTLTDRDASTMVVGGSLGEMVLPVLIGWLLSPKNGGCPATLYVVCVVASFMTLAVYVASYRVAISWYNIGGTHEST